MLLGDWEEWREPPEGSWGAVVMLPASLGAKMLRQPPAFTARAEGEVAQARVAALLPLRPGAKGRHGRDGLTILTLDASTGAQIKMTIAQSWSTAGRLTIFDAAVASYEEANEWRWGCWIFSQDKTRVVGADSVGFITHRIGTVAVVRRQLRVRATTRWAGHDGDRSLWTVDPEWPGWLEHATLARVVEDPVGRFEQALQVERMVVQPEQARPATAH